MDDPLDIRAEILKVDEQLGLVMGWAIVCEKEGKAYFDTQGDHIPEKTMLESAADFAKSARIAGHQHAKSDSGDVVPAGTIVFIWPMTADIAKAFNVETKTTGLMIAMQPEEKMLQKFKDGTLTGFSIGGWLTESEIVEDAS